MIAPLTADARIERAGLPGVHRAQAVGVERHRVAWRQARRLQIDGLSADQAGGAGRVADGLQDAQLPRQR